MQKVSFDFIDHELGISYIHKNIPKGKAKSDLPHTHKDLFEIFMLVEGDVDYVIDGKQFHLSPYDIVLVNNDELHRSIISDSCDFECILLSINLDFFIKNNCTDFTGMIFNRPSGANNIIPSQAVAESGIYGIYNKLELYTSEDIPCIPVIKSMVIELLYNINKHIIKSRNVHYSQKNIKEILQYINNHLTEDLSLEAIAAHFFITKQHLCKSFKKNTGYTIKKYVSQKRLVLVREFYAGGMTLSEACIRAGFTDYSAFYRTFKNIMHQSPSQSLADIQFHFENSPTQNSSNF